MQYAAIGDYEGKGTCDICNRHDQHLYRDEREGQYGTEPCKVCTHCIGRDEEEGE